jgi:hypothetical protein
MPALRATDPADLEAWACAELGFSRQLKQPRQVAPHPSLGGSSGYPVWHREEQLERWDAGEVTDVSEWSLFHWTRCLKPYRQTGNRERSQIIGTELLDLVTYITAWPDAILDEMAHRQSGGGSAAVARQWQATRRQRREHERGDGSASVAVAAAEAAWQRRAVGRQAAAERWWRWQHSGGVGSVVAASAAQWQLWQKQHGSSAAEASSVEAASAARCWRRERGGSIGRAAEAVRQRRYDSGQHGGGVASARAAALRSGNGDGGGGSSAAVSSGDAG